MATTFTARGVKLTTVKKWQAEVDPKQIWLRYESDELSQGTVISIKCALCEKHESKIRDVRNFSKAFITGTTGSALKKDNLVKHSKSDPHKRALDIEDNLCFPRKQLVLKSPLVRAFAGANKEEQERLKKLFNICYALAKEELGFRKFPTFVSLEKKNGVQLGNSYANEIKCQEFTCIIGNELRHELVELIRGAEYFTVLMDGATDVSATEKEVIYILFVTPEGQVETRLLRLKNVAFANSPGLKQCIVDSFTELDIHNMDTKLVGFMADGANVNLGVKKGVSALLKEDMNWIVAIHCLNHRLELAAKDAFAETYMMEVINMLVNLYYLYQNSPKRLRELRSLADIMDDVVHKPDKAQGTRWLQHKRRACNSLIKSYQVIVSHLENLAEDGATKGPDKAKMTGYLTKLKNFHFVIHLLHFSDLLEPLSKLSLSLQGNSVDLLYAMSCLQNFYAALDSQNHSHALKHLLQDANNHVNEIEFHGVKLTRINLGAAEFRDGRRPPYVNKIEECVRKRFGDLHEAKVFQSLKLLNTDIWPKDLSVLRTFGNEELDYFTRHFKDLLEANEVDLQQLQVSNEKLERAFSAMARIKTDWRNRLGENTTECLLRISLEGPELQEFDATNAVNKFLESTRHTNVLPYGSKKDTQTD